MSDLSLEVTLGADGAVFVKVNAKGALSFRFSFGDNAVFNNTSGEIEYIYKLNGSHTLGVWAFFDEQQTAYSYETVAVDIKNASGGTLQNPDQGFIDNSEQATTYSGYTLVWNDEFNYEGAPLDSRWHLQYIPIFGGGWANDERQHYTTRRDNSIVGDGTLKIIAKKENYTYSGSQKQYTSARLNSKFHFQYGRVDVKAKLPASAGTWPAIWTLGSNVNEVGNYFGDQYGNVGWPACGEIDIMEHTGTDKSKVQGHFHWADTQTGEYGSYGEQKSLADLGISDLSSDFHVYSLIWNKSSLQILIDDQLIVQLSNTVNVPFDNPHYILLNLAMGGTLGGNIPADFEQARMEIDYVRIYQ